MANPALVSKGLLLAKTQSAENVIASPSPSADALLASGEITVGYTSEKIRRQIIVPHLSPLGSVFSIRTGTMQFQTELRGKATAVFDATTNKLRDDPLWQAAGCTVSYASNSSSAVIKPASSLTATVPPTIYAYLDALLHVFMNVRGTGVINAEDGGFGVINWNLQGIFLTIPAGAGSDPSTEGILDSAIPNATFDSLSTLPPQVMKDNCFRTNFGANAYPILQAFSLDLGNDVQQRPNANKNQGLEGIFIADRAPTMQFNPELALKATTGQDWFRYAQQRTRGVIDVTFGQDAGNTVVVNAPAVELDWPTYENRNGARALSVGAEPCANSSAGDDEWTITIK